MEVIRPVQEDVDSELSEVEEDLINSNVEANAAAEEEYQEQPDLMPDNQKKMDDTELMELEKLVQQEQQTLEVERVPV